MDSKSNPNPYIMKIKGNSLDDGPGIRSVIFFKGCNLQCVWCHNPESISFQPELFYEPTKCIGCKECISKCTNNCLSFGTKLAIDRIQCKKCFKCVDACNSNALEKIGNTYSVSEIVEKILPYAPFYKTSGGGVTLSGGEPTVHMEFIHQLLKEIKKHDIQVLMETNGNFSFEKFTEKILPFVDIIYMDIKLIDPEGHKKYCGISNNSILTNFEQLWNMSQADSKFKIIPRIPLIPEITDTTENIIGIINFFKRIGVDTVRVLPNNAIWFDKCEKFGYSRPFQAGHTAYQMYAREALEKIEKMFQDAGIHF